MKQIYLGSDIMTTTPDIMWQAMKYANLSPVKEGGERNIEKLRQRIYELTGYEDIALVPTCSIANLSALMSYGTPGDQIVADSLTHFLWYEGNGVAAIAGKRVRLIDTQDGILSANEVEQAIRYSVCHQDCRTAAVFLENTHTIGGGRAYPIQRLEEIAEVAARYKAGIHMDGARIFNAVVSANTTLRDIAKYVDSLSRNLNKVLGVPFGALLCGSASFMQEAKKHIKTIGGHSMHKAGMLAAAALTRLDEESYPVFLQSLSDLHQRTYAFAARLAQIPGITVDLEKVESNLFFINVAKLLVDSDEFLEEMRESGVIGSYRDSERIRFVVSTDRTESELEEAADTIEQLAKRHNM